MVGSGLARPRRRPRGQTLPAHEEFRMAFSASRASRGSEIGTAQEKVQDDFTRDGRTGEDDSAMGEDTQGQWLHRDHKYRPLFRNWDKVVEKFSKVRRYDKTGFSTVAEQIGQT
jgi:hypothetical protein